MALEYSVVSAQAVEPFEHRCSMKTATNWVAQGGVSTVFNTSGGYVVYSQAFVRERKLTTDPVKPKRITKKNTKMNDKASF